MQNNIKNAQQNCCVRAYRTPANQNKKLISPQQQNNVSPLLACRLAVSDFPSGSFVTSTTRYPTSSWLPESVDALLAEGTKLKYIVYTHSHWVSATLFLYRASPVVVTVVAVVVVCMAFGPSTHHAGYVQSRIFVLIARAPREFRPLYQ